MLNSALVLTEQTSMSHLRHQKWHLRLLILGIIPQTISPSVTYSSGEVPKGHLMHLSPKFQRNHWQGCHSDLPAPWPEANTDTKWPMLYSLPLKSLHSSKQWSAATTEPHDRQLRPQVHTMSLENRVQTSPLEDTAVRCHCPQPGSDLVNWSPSADILQSQQGPRLECPM